MFAVEVFLPPALQEGMVKTFAFSLSSLREHPWNVITAAFLHAGVQHVVLNVLALLCFGAVVEANIRWYGMLGVFLAASVAGNFASAAAYGSDAVCVGASGGIFGLMGVATVVDPFRLSIYPFILPVPVGVTGLLYVVSNATQMYYARADGISYAAHLGGALVGGVVGTRLTGARRAVKTLLLLAVLTFLLPLAVRTVLAYSGW